MQNEMLQVKDFIERISKQPCAPISAFTLDIQTSVVLNRCCDTVLAKSGLLLEEYRIHKDIRALRVHLILEEVGEFIQAVRLCNQVEMLDALCDILYVVIGTALTFDLPLQEGFNEVHNSNMTKQPSNEPRVSDKGNTYRAPDLQRVLNLYRNSQ